MFATVSLSAQAENELSIDSITAGAYNAEYISGINPVKGTDEYTQISLDGKRIERYSFKTGKLTGVLFDISVYAFDIQVLYVVDVEQYPG